VHLLFEIPARGLFGYRSEFLTDTKGTGILNQMFLDYQPHRGDIPGRNRGVLISMEEGEAVPYTMQNIQERGTLFAKPGDKLYVGMIVGENSRADDMVVNLCKKKHLTNIRSSGAEDAVVLTTPRKMSLEQAIEFIADDELVEVTPLTVRLRKKLLSEHDRKRSRNK
ncbi:MAG TPA: translational GTPase TypA, partial [Nitrospiria bacterium]